MTTLFALAVLGCAATRSSVKEEVTAPAEMSLALHWSRNSIEHDALLVQAYGLATERVRALAVEKGPLGWAVILDVDETVLDNSQYQKEREEAGLPYTPETFAAWSERKEAPPLPGAIAFLREVHLNGGSIALVTNRSAGECPATEANLRAHEVPFDLVLCKGDVSDKKPRWDAVADGSAWPDGKPREVVMWVGDNIHDFPGLSQDSAEADLALVGKAYIVLPNPMYGSWVSRPRN